ncbi:MAG: flagellar hook-basal body complex protein FliE [Planctomycetia bacterium]|nr:flagellar hook-basal body complex protein FliE [Planctomycetia bacterium]
MTPINGISIPPSLARGLENLKGIEGFEGIEAFSSPQDASPSFKEFMLDALDHVNTMQHDADHAVEQLATGEEVNAAEVLTAVQKADLSFRVMMQIRNKLIQAYQEIKEIRI